MSQHDDRVRLRHMLDYGQEALVLTKGKHRADLESDHILALALTRLLEIVGEAANRVSQEAQKQYPQIPWRQIVGLRHRLIHGYDAVDLDISGRASSCPADSSRYSQPTARSSGTRYPHPPTTATAIPTSALMPDEPPQPNIYEAHSA